MKQYDRPQIKDRPSGCVERRTSVPAFVEPTSGDDGPFSDMLKVEPMKRPGLIKAKVDIAQTPENPCYVSEATITYTHSRRRKSVWGP